MIPSHEQHHFCFSLYSFRSWVLWQSWPFSSSFIYSFYLLPHQKWIILYAFFHALDWYFVCSQIIFKFYQNVGHAFILRAVSSLPVKRFPAFQRFFFSSWCNVWQIWFMYNKWLIFTFQITQIISVFLTCLFWCHKLLFLGKKRLRFYVGGNENSATTWF